MVSIQTIDESTTGARLSGPILKLLQAELTVRELIRARVLAEVTAYNESRAEAFYGLVQPDDVETFFNGLRKRKFKPIDPEKQIEVAISAFEAQRILVLLPTGQATSLDQSITLCDRDEVLFLRLIPLIGG